MSNKKIDLYADGLTLDNYLIRIMALQLMVSTFNPSIFRKSGAKDYLDYSKNFV